MKRLLLLVILACQHFVHAHVQERRDGTRERSFTAFLAEWEAAQARPLEGDPAQ